MIANAILMLKARNKNSNVDAENETDYNCKSKIPQPKELQEYLYDRKNPPSTKFHNVRIIKYRKDEFETSEVNQSGWNGLDKTTLDNSCEKLIKIRSFNLEHSYTHKCWSKKMHAIILIGILLTNLGIIIQSLVQKMPEFAGFSVIFGSLLMLLLTCIRAITNDKMVQVYIKRRKHSLNKCQNNINKDCLEKYNCFLSGVNDFAWLVLYKNAKFSTHFIDEEGNLKKLNRKDSFDDSVNTYNSNINEIPDEFNEANNKIEVKYSEKYSSTKEYKIHTLTELKSAPMPFQPYDRSLSKSSEGFYKNPNYTTNNNINFSFNLNLGAKDTEISSQRQIKIKPYRNKKQTLKSKTMSNRYQSYSTKIFLEKKCKETRKILSKLTDQKIEEEKLKGKKFGETMPFHKKVPKKKLYKPRVDDICLSEDLRIGTYKLKKDRSQNFDERKIQSLRDI